MKARANWREKQPEALVDNRPVVELTDEELTAIIRKARDDGALPTSHLTIRRVIIDPKAPGPVIDGLVREVTHD